MFGSVLILTAKFDAERYDDSIQASDFVITAIRTDWANYLGILARIKNWRRAKP